MTILNLNHAFGPASVGILGATTGPRSPGGIALQNLTASFGGDIAHLDGAEPDGAAALPELVVIADVASVSPQTINTLGTGGTRTAVLLPDLDLDRAAKRALLEAARPHVLRLIGTGTIGVIAPYANLNASYAQLMPPAGDLALITQSNAIVTAVIDWAAPRGIGFSGIIGLGDRLDVDTSDMLDFFASDIHTRAILLQVDEIRERRKFLSAARAAARAKPVLIIKGRGNEEQGSHRGSHASVLATSDAVEDTAFSRAGLLRVNDLEEMFSAAATLSRARPFRGDRVTLISNSETVARLAADKLTRLGAPRVQTAFTGSDAVPSAYSEALAAALDDTDTDAVLVLNAPSAFVDETAVAQAIADTTAERRGKVWPAKPVFASLIGGASAESGRDLLDQKGVAGFRTPDSAVRGIMHLVSYQRRLDQLMRTPESLPDGFEPDFHAAETLLAKALTDGSDWLSASAAADLITAYGIPVAACLFAATPDAAAHAADTLLADHDAVVVKISGKSARHKTDIGGVRLELPSADAARIAARDLLARAEALGLSDGVDGITVHPMIRRARARELILGVTDDPTYGPTMVFGQGGIAVELVADKALALPPLDLTLAHDMIAATRIAGQLDAFRGAPAADKDAIALALVKLSQLAADHPSVREIDINPLLANADGIIALDVRVRIAKETRSDRHGVNPRFAIRPYPKQWEQTLTLKDGSEVLARPVRPEDEALYEDFFEDVTREDMRLRFFTPTPNLSHKFLARLTQIDYGRAMAFMALKPEDGSLLGVVRIHADADHRRGEYAILLRSSLKGLGLGWTLMKLIIDYARIDGLEEIYGEVLAENRTMLAMCRSLGFAVVRDHDDSALMHVSFDLTADEDAD
ncbi:MAG: GNAT family N-acetyltransferase [Pseudomonadota bacterium]